MHINIRKITILFCLITPFFLKKKILKIKNINKQVKVQNNKFFKQKKKKIHVLKTINKRSLHCIFKCIHNFS
jgi:hypothetical protein